MLPPIQAVASVIDNLDNSSFLRSGSTLLNIYLDMSSAIVNSVVLNEDIKLNCNSFLISGFKDLNCISVNILILFKYANFDCSSVDLVVFLVNASISFDNVSSVYGFFKLLIDLSTFLGSGFFISDFP